MKAMFVNSDGCIDYAFAIATGYKTIETRFRNMLAPLVGERVAVVRTRRGKNPKIIGFVTVMAGVWMNHRIFGEYSNQHLIPEGSKYDCKPNGGKWCYFLCGAEFCSPRDLPKDTIRHGRSWCEFQEVGA